MTEDVVRMGAGLTQESIEYLQSNISSSTSTNDTVVLRIRETGDTLTLLDWFLAEGYKVDKIIFSDGSELTSAQLSDLVMIQGTDGVDNIYGSDHHGDKIYGHGGNDALYGNDGDDQIFGGTGNDTLDGGVGSDTMSGGLADDVYSIDDIGDCVVENTNEGIDTVKSSISYTMEANVENLILTGTADINGIGNSLNNIITGNSGDNQMAGGQGDDIYIAATAGDAVIENADEGTDTVQSTIAYTLGANVENLTLAGSSAINGIGNELNNIIIGNVAINNMSGGLGDDTYVVNSGDIVIENVDEGIDTVKSSTTCALGVNIENLTLVGTANINGTGNTQNNVLTAIAEPIPWTVGRARHHGWWCR